MDTFKSVTATPTIDPTKHVNYTYGMVLGVDDFTQEFAYHSERDHWMTRDIDGYGTVNGLRVTVEENKAGELEVVVTAGAAVTPRGQLVCVSPGQCANLNKWLAVAKNREGVEGRVGDPPSAPVRLYVVLCYRDCPVDKVPVPGEPCRDEGEATAPSRLKDDFKLELRTDAPAQPEEDALRDFVRWLVDHVEFTDEPGTFTDLDTFLARLRAAAQGIDSPPSSPPDFMLDSPLDVMRVHLADRCEYLRAAFLLWVTELRPRWRPEHFGRECHCPEGAHADEREGHGDEDCVLLAELIVPLTPAFQVDEAQGVEVLQDRRPFLLHQRMLQEWLLCGELQYGAVAAAAGGGPPPAPPAAVPQVFPLVTILRVAAESPLFRLWFHIDAPGNAAAIVSFTAADFSVVRETNTGPSFLTNITKTVAAVAGRRNLFDVTAGGDFDRMRFVFNLGTIQVVPVSGGAAQSLLSYAEGNNIRFVGQDEAATVTAYPPLFFPVS